MQYVLGVMRPAVRILLQAVHHQVVDVSRDVLRRPRRWRLRDRLHVMQQEAHRGVGVEQGLAGQQVVEKSSECIHVNPAVDRLAENRFRRM